MLETQTDQSNHGRFVHNLFSRPETWQRLFAITLIAGGLWIWFTQPDSGSTVEAVDPAPRIGAPAPLFSATILEGDTITMEELRGQVVVLNLWATWCPPCRAEMPSLERIWQRYRENGLIILALNEQESQQQVAAFRDEFSLSFPIALDPDGSIGREYLLMAYPSTFFIGRNGTVRDIVYGGPMPEALLESKITPLLAEK